MDNKVEYILSLKDLFSSKIKDATNETEKLNKTVDNTSISLSSLGKLAAGAFASIGIASIGKSILEVGSNFESAEMGLKTLLKSGSQAQAVFGEIQKDAATTPFDFNSLLMANRALISTGMSASDSRRDVLNLGNAIAATGGGNDELQRMVVNLQQIRNTGKATAMDIKQFAFAGINIYGLLADATGKQVSEVKDMEVSYDLLAYAFQKAGEKGGAYFEGSKNAMLTTQGRLSNLSDQFAAFQKQLFDELKPTINSVIDSLSNLMNIGLKSVIWIKEHKAEIKTLGIAIATFTGMYVLTQVPAMIAATRMLAYNLTMMGLAGASAWAKVTLGLSLVIPAIYYAYQKFEGFRNVVWGVWEAVKVLASGMKDLFIGITTFNPAKIATSLATLSGVGKAYATGVFKNKREESVLRDKENASKLTGGLGIAAGGGKGLLEKPETPPPNDASKVHGVKPTNIYINIGKLIENQSIRVENATADFTDKLYEAVSQVLLNVVNDANRIGTQ